MLVYSQVWPEERFRATGCSGGERGAAVESEEQRLKLDADARSTSENLAQLPRPVHHRIPNFVEAGAAAAKGDNAGEALDGAAVDCSICAWFWKQAHPSEQQGIIQVPTVIAAPTYYVLHIVRDGVTFLACAKSKMPPLLGIEITALKEKLADAERATRDVLRGVEVDMAIVTVCEHHNTTVRTRVEKQQQVEDAHVNLSNKRTLQKDEEVERILTQLHNFIEEREGWLEVISRKQAELTATQVAMEKLRERDMALVAENKKFKNENRMQVKKMGQLEQEIKTLSGQQTKHHVKIKEENNALRIQSNDLSAKLRRVEHVNARFSDELAKYRIAQGRPPLLNIDEEQRLRTRLQAAQEQSSELAKKLASFSASVMKATGMLDCNNINTGSPSVALKALQQMKANLESTQLELDNFKLKTKIVEERQRLSEIRSTHSPMRGIDSQSVKPR